MMKPALALLIAASAALSLSACETGPGDLTYSQSGKQISKQFTSFSSVIPKSDQLSTLKYQAQQTQCDANTYSESVQQVTYVSKDFDLKSYLAKAEAAAKKQGFTRDSKVAATDSSVPGSKRLGLKNGADFHYTLVTLSNVMKKDVKTTKAVLFAATGPCVPEK